MAALVNGVPQSMVQPDSPSFAFRLWNAVVYCSLAPVTAQFVTGGVMEILGGGGG